MEVEDLAGLVPQELCLLVLLLLQLQQQRSPRLEGLLPGCLQLLPGLLNFLLDPGQFLLLFPGHLQLLLVHSLAHHGHAGHILAHLLLLHPGDTLPLSGQQQLGHVLLLLLLALADAAWLLGLPGDACPRLIGLTDNACPQLLALPDDAYPWLLGLLDDTRPRLLALPDDACPWLLSLLEDACPRLHVRGQQRQQRALYALPLLTSLALFLASLFSASLALCAPRISLASNVSSAQSARCRC